MTRVEGMTRTITGYAEALCAAAGVAAPCDDASLRIGDRDSNKDKNRSVHIEFEEPLQRDGHSLIAATDSCYMCIQCCITVDHDPKGQSSRSNPSRDAHLTFCSAHCLDAGSPGQTSQTVAELAALYHHIELILRNTMNTCNLLSFHSIK